MLRKALILSLILLPPHAAHAGDDGDTRVVYKSTTEIDFEELEIEGILQRPQSQLLLERKKASFNPLIKLRAEWNAEMDRSVDEVK